MKKKWFSFEQSPMATINLEPMRFRLCLPPGERGGLGWSPAKAEEVERLYRRWLFLCYIKPETRLAPTKEIDIFWHMHILDTAKYEVDCREMFGQTLHHYPYTGMRNEEDASQHRERFEEMKILYAENFGDVVRSESETALCSACYCDSDVTDPATKIAGFWRPGMSDLDRLTAS
jgi:hypothetical protein